VIEGGKVLVVDDDQVFRTVISRWFGKRGMSVIAQASAYGLLNAVAMHRPRLVLVDVMMPGLDGPSVVDLIRKDPELQQTTVILCSSMEESALAKRAQACAANGYVSKTGGLPAVQSELGRLLGRFKTPTS
jgi:CheY-like chemotaxis protein